MTAFPAKWRDRGRRLLAMPQDELWERSCQQLRMRWDALRYKAGFGFEVPTRRVDATTVPRFFFPKASLPGLAALLKQRLPEQTDCIVQQAERIYQHRFDLLGYEDLDYGKDKDIDWHCDLVHNKRAPRKPWFKVRYLDFQEVGDSKIIWELNRHQHFVTLAKAYLLTGAEEFAGEIFRQWRHWHAQNPYPIGVNWASSLEVAFRSLSWTWTYFLLEGSTVMPREFRDQWVQALGLSGRHIERYLSTYFSPNTHILGEAVALFFIGTMCPELRSAERWKRHGWNLVLQESQRQVQADGFHFEQSTYYHVYALDFFLHARILATLNGVAVPAEFDRTLGKMLDVLCVLGRSGAPPQLGDDDGGRLFDPRRNRAMHLLDPLAAGAVLFRRGDFKSVAGGLCEETVWLLGEQGVAEFDRLPAQEPTSSSVGLTTSGLYVLAGAPKQFLVVDAGPQGAATAGHGHADALSVSLHSEGRSLLRDSGTFEYVGEGQDRDLLRGTSAHNTLVVDGVSQAEPKGPFGWNSLPNVKAERWVNGQTFDLFVGSHDGYHRLAYPVTHRRWVFSLKSHFWLIRDLAMGEGEHQLELFWHVGPELSSRGVGDHVFLDVEGRKGLCLLTPEGHGWSQDRVRCEWSPAYGRKEPAWALRLGTTAVLPTEFATLLVLASAASAGEVGQLTKTDQLSEPHCGSVYRYATPDEDHLMIFADRDARWTHRPWTSNSRFFYYGERKTSGRRTLIVCDGTYVNFEGQQILSSSSRQSRCEIVHSAQDTVISSDAGVVVAKELLECIWAEPALVDSSSTLARTGS